MGEPETVYVTYIATTPDKVWTALTDGEMSRQYLFSRIESDWKIGPPWTLRGEDGSVNCEGKVLEADRPRRLSITWKAASCEETRDFPAAVVTYRIDDLGGVSRLTLMESADETVDEKNRAGSRHGWQIIMSNLKTLLETGRALPKFNMSG